MSMVTVDFLGQTGLIKDRKPYDLGPEFFTDALNVAFEEGEARSNINWQPMLNLAAFGAYGLFYVHSPLTRYWVMTGLAGIKSISDTTVTVRTRGAGPYTGGGLDFWNGGMFNDILILNNGIDKPQSWDLPGGAALLVDLPNWPATVRAKVVHPFKNFLVALNVSKAGVRDDRMVKWSHIAAPLTVPISWDETDPTIEAGEITLSEGEDVIVDGLVVGDQFAIGTNNQTWAMRFVGGQDVFAFQKVFGEVGLLTQGAWTTFLNKVFQITADDFIVHDLNSLESIGSGSVRRWFFDQLTTTNYPYVRVVRKVSAKEVWILLPGAGVTYTTLALIWNWQFNTWSLRDVPATYAVASGYTTDSTATNKFKDRLGLVSTAPYLHEHIDTHVSGLVNLTYVERTGLAIKAGGDGKPAIDHGSIAVLREFWPKIDAADGEVFEITIGFQLFRHDPVTWLPVKYFTVGTDQKVTAWGSYRYLAYRVAHTNSGVGAQVPWRFLGFELDLDMSGNF
jgi:hypothetical protein